MSNKNKLAHNLRQSCIYHILKSRNKEERIKDFVNIIEFKFKDSNYIDDDGINKNFISDIETFTIRYIWRSKMKNY